MKLMDWIDRQPARVGFGTFTGGSAAPATDPRTEGLPPPPDILAAPDFESRAVVEVTDIDPTITFVRTAGYFVAGDGGGGLYTRRDTPPPHNLWVQSVDGGYWELVLENGIVNEKQAGGIGDGVADDTSAIQSAIDYVVYNTGTSFGALPAEVLIIGPLCKVTDTIHLGYGENFHGVTVRGNSRRRRAGGNNSGTALVATFTDRPIIAIQGARTTILSDIWLEGALDITGLDVEGLAITEEATWDALGGEGRYNPYAAVAVDPYSGTRPASSYPDVTFPSYLQHLGQYDKLFSSDVLLDNVGINRVNTGVAVQPCDADGNADFVKIVDCEISGAKYGISIGNSQSRNVEIRNLVSFLVHVGLTNDTHGRQRGVFGGPILNAAFAQFVGRIFKFSNTAALGTTVFQNLYAESLDRIGDFSGSTLNEGALTFESCQFRFRHNETRGIPSNILSGGNLGMLKFRACRFEGAPSVYSVDHRNLEFENCRISADARSDITVPRYEAFAHNVLSGGLVTDSQFLSPHSVAFRPFNLETGAPLGGTLPKDGLFRDSTRDTCVPAAVWSYLHKSELFGQPTRKRFNYYDRRKDTHFNSVTLVDRTLTLVFSSLIDNQAMRFGVLPGDVIRDIDTGMVFFIRSRSGTTVIAEAQNNYISNGSGGYDTVTAFSTTSGRLQFINSRVYTPSYQTLMDFTGGSSQASSIGRADGFATYLDTDVVPGDYLYADQDEDRIFTGGNAEVTAVDGTARTMTFAGGATNGATRKTVAQWIRTPPPNV